MVVLLYYVMFIWIFFFFVVLFDGRVYCEEDIMLVRIVLNKNVRFVVLEILDGVVVVKVEVVFVFLFVLNCWWVVFLDFIVFKWVL